MRCCQVCKTKRAGLGLRCNVTNLRTSRSSSLCSPDGYWNNILSSQPDVGDGDFTLEVSFRPNGDTFKTSNTLRYLYTYTIQDGASRLIGEPMTVSSQIGGVACFHANRYHKEIPNHDKSQWNDRRLTDQNINPCRQVVSMPLINSPRASSFR